MPHNIDVNVNAMQIHQFVDKWQPQRRLLSLQKLFIGNDWKVLMTRSLSRHTDLGSLGATMNEDELQFKELIQELQISSTLYSP